MLMKTQASPIAFFRHLDELAQNTFFFLKNLPESVHLHLNG